ncbi:MAG: hypothetical protein Q8N17_11735 [Burkholderiaceae bacterium]|nr:hypothetical protein [Burkholderiaceae bacterium]
MRGNPSLNPRVAMAALAVVSACAGSGCGVAQAAAASATMAGSVGEMLRLETEKAVADTRRRVAAAAPEPAADAKPGAVVDGQPRAAGPSGGASRSDILELLGTWRRGDTRAADLAVNGVVTQVGAGDQLGAYQVKAVATHCVHLLYRQRTEMLRCISGHKP